MPVFVFHPAGGSTVVYEPLLKRLPAGHPDVRHRAGRGLRRGARRRVRAEAAGDAGDGPFILAGWSLGGALAYACAIGLKQAGADVRFVGLIDTVRAGEEIPQTKEETRARWDRYARFAERTFNVQVPAIPYEQLEELDDDGPGAVRARRRQGERRADSRRRHRAPAHVVSGQPAARHRRDPALRRTRHALHGRPLPRRRDLLRAALRHPQAGRRLGRVRVRPGGRADRGRAHPGDRRAVHCQGRRAHERGDQPDRGARRSRRSDQPNRSPLRDHCGEAGRTSRKAGAGKGTRW